VPHAVDLGDVPQGRLGAKIDPRFDGPKARALIALLIYLGPLLRGWARIKWRLRRCRRRSRRARCDRAARELGVAHTRFRALVLERDRHREGAMLGALIGVAPPSTYPVAMDVDGRIGTRYAAGRPAARALLIAGENMARQAAAARRAVLAPVMPRARHGGRLSV